MPLTGGKERGEYLVFADKFQVFKSARPGKARRLLIVPFKNKLVECFIGSSSDPAATPYWRRFQVKKCSY